MSIFAIKVVAVVTMVIDHIGLFFFPDIFLFRLVGRLSLPLFAWLIGNGALHTKNINLYVKRLFALAIISQIPYAYANRLMDPLFAGLNVVFTLFLGLITVIILQKTNNKVIRFFGITSTILLAILFRTDYGALGILSVLTFYLFYKSQIWLIISQVTLLFFLPYLTIILEYRYHTDLSIFYFDSFYEFFGLFSLIFIAFYNQKLGYNSKLLFYLFYPLQYIVVIILKLL